MAIPFAQINSQLTNRKSVTTPQSNTRNVQDNSRSAINRLTSTRKRISDSKIVVEPKKSLIDKAKEKISGVFNRPKYEPIKLPSGFNLTISAPKKMESFGLEPAKESSSARFTPETEKMVADFYDPKNMRVRRQSIQDEVISSSRDVRPGYKEPGIFGSIIESIKESTISLGSSFGATIEMVGTMQGFMGVTKAGQKIQKEAEKVLASNPEWREEEGAKWSPKKVSRLVAGAVPSLLGTIGATLVAGVPGGVAMAFSMEAGSPYAEAIKAGKTEEEATKVGFLVGSVNAVLEKIFPSKLLDKDKVVKESIEQVNKSVVKNVIKKAKDFGIKFTKDGTLEGGTEALQELWANVVATSYDEDRKWWDNLLEAFVGGFGSGGIAGTFEGEYTPQEIIDQVMNTPMENTTEGKLLIKNALEAQKGGNNIVIAPQETSQEKNAKKESKPTAERKTKIKELSNQYVTGKKLNEGVNVDKISIEDNRTNKSKDGIEVIKEVVDYKTKTSTGKSGVETTVNIPVVITEKIDTPSIKDTTKDIKDQGKASQEVVETESVSEYVKTKSQKFQQDKINDLGHYTESRYKDSSYAKTFIAKNDIPDTVIKKGDRVAIIDHGSKGTDYTALLAKPIKDKSTGVSVSREKNINPKDFSNESESKKAKKGEKPPEVKKPKQPKKTTIKKVAKTKPSKLKKKTKKQKIKDIEAYVDKKTTKFRTDDTKDIVVVENEKVTSKFLENKDVKGKEQAGYQYLFDLSKSNSLGLKPKEQKIIQDVLVKNFQGQKRVDMAEFRRAVIGQLMPLDAIPTDTYSSYGSDNLGMNPDDTKTYILNSPFDHGQTGHFSNDFSEALITKDDVEIKEIPVQAQNVSEKYAVVRKGVTLTEENISDNVLTLEATREDAEKWLNNIDGNRLPVSAKKGLFSHFRAFDVDDTAHIAEVQSDAFQRLGRIDQRKDLERDLNARKERVKDLKISLKRVGTKGFTGGKGADALTRADINESIKNTEISIVNVEGQIKELGDPKREETQFLGYKSIWHERSVREAITIKAREGFDVIRFPTPRTVAVIEGFAGGEEGNRMPYEITSADNHESLDVGDTIDYGGEDMTVVKATNYAITVAPTEKVNSFSDYDARQEEVEYRLDDTRSQFEDIESEWGKIDTPDKAQTVLNKADSLNNLIKYESKNKDIERENKNHEENADISQAKDRIAKSEVKIAEYKKFKKLLEGGVIEKEGLTVDNIQNNMELKDRLEQKYGLGHAYWNYLFDVYANDTMDVLKEHAIQTSKEQIEESESVIQKHKNDIESINSKHENTISEIKSRKKPKPESLKDIPKNLIESVNSYTYGYSLDYEVEQLLEKMSGSGEESFDFDTFEEDITDSLLENQEMNYEDVYDNVFYDESGSDTQVYTVEGHVEEFQQPDEYEDAPDIDNFDISDYDGSQRTVLEFYRKQVNPYIQKLRKGNIEKIEDDNGYEWYETKVTEQDQLPPTAYRIKEDLEKVGIEISDAQEQEILALNKKIFGDENVKIVTQILANNTALGSYSENMIKILKKQGNAKDTFLHEAVHKYLDSFTTKQEYVKVLSEAQEKYQIEDLAEVEERVAEDFIKYVQAGRKTGFFSKVIARIKAYLKNQKSIDKLYADIISGKAVKEKGKTQASKVAVSIEKNVGEKFDKLAGFETINVKDQAMRSADLVFNDLEKARSIINGKTPLPSGLRAGMLIKTMEEYATQAGDIDLLRELAVSPLVAETSVHAQELRLLAERDENSVLSKMQDLASERAKVVEKRHGTIEKAIKKETAKIKKEIKKPSKYNWNDFVKSIEC